MDPTERARRTELLRRQLAVSRGVLGELRDWAGHPPSVGPADWAGPAALAHALACEGLRGSLLRAADAADRLVAVTAAAVAVEESR